MKKSAYSREDEDILAKTIFGEARGEYCKTGISGLIAIGNVVVNRVNKGGFFGESVAAVCKKPWQFSCWNVGDPNLVVITKANRLDFLFNVCHEVAVALLDGKLPDLTQGSDHYHSCYVKPKWAENAIPKLRLGKHVFYKLRP
ncbi:MAG: cell wall hydrolase [Holosporales bacterium]|jgi:spore germination cell wall hydrolase CwlJ-like protein|nr:cell wall hydrolase [Holosporales bacterium]